MSLLRPIDVRRDVRAIVSSIISRHAGCGASIYDIGCGSKPFAGMVRALGCTYTGVDIADGFYDTNPEITGSADHVPVPDGVADMVLSSQVLEHLESPVEALREAHRILKPGGLLVVSFPFLYPIHALPFDYGRYTRFFMASVADKMTFDLIEEHALCGYWYAVGILSALYLQGFDRGVLRFTKIVKLLIALIQWFCIGMNNIEGYFLRLSGRQPEKFRLPWPVNYVFALVKQVPRC